jgi:hypothetical protein
LPTANATTYSLKTLAGNDPSADDPVLVCFRNATAATGNYVYRTATAALSLTLPSGATLGASSGSVPFDVWLALIDDAGTIRLGAINATPPGVAHYDLAQIPPIASSTTVGTGSDAAKTWYTDSGVTSKAYAVIAVAKYSSGLVTAGTWNVSPTTIQPYGHGVPLPDERTTTGRAAAKAWVTFEGDATPTIIASHNVTSVSRVGVGQWTVTIDTDMSSANYTVTATVFNTNVAIAWVTARAAGTFNVATVDAAGSGLDVTQVMADCYGDQ